MQYINLTMQNIKHCNYVINYVTAGEVARINYTSYKLCCKLCGCRSDGQNRLRESRKQPNFACFGIRETEQRVSVLYVWSNSLGLVIMVNK